MYRPLGIALTAIAVMLSIYSNAQPASVGVYNSLKGIGATLEIPHGESEFTSIVAFTEIYGIPTGRCDSPGFKARYSHNFIFKTYEQEATIFMLYAGPGVTAGYMRDFELGRRIDKTLTLTHNPGLMAALCGSLGCRFSFESRIALDLSFTADLGIHARQNEELHNIDVRMYRNGLMQAFYPELSILVYL